MRRPRVSVSILIAAVLLGAALILPAALGAVGGSANAWRTGSVGSSGKRLRIPDSADRSAQPSPSTGSTAPDSPAASPPSASPPASPPAASPPAVTPPAVTSEPTMQAPGTPLAVPATDFFGWALLDRRTGAISGSANLATGTNSTESMIKVWIVSDYLRQLPAGQWPPNETLNELAAAIVHSDDDTAEKYYRLAGGNAVVERMISMCGLTATTMYDGWWSRTEMSPQDAVRMGRCVADGIAAGPTWTNWVLTEMTEVQGGVADQQNTTGGGRWGIIDGLPASLATGLAIKNGWTPIGTDGDWHVNNLAISANWVLAVMVRYPITKGLQYGADICSSVARQLLTQPRG